MVTLDSVPGDVVVTGSDDVVGEMLTDTVASDLEPAVIAINENKSFITYADVKILILCKVTVLKAEYKIILQLKTSDEFSVHSNIV